MAMEIVYFRKKDIEDLKTELQTFLDNDGQIIQVYHEYRPLQDSRHVAWGILETESEGEL